MYLIYLHLRQLQLKVKFCNQIRVTAKSDSLGIPSPLAESPLWEACCGAQNLHNSGRTFLVLLFSFLGHSPGGCGIWFYHDCVTPTAWLQLLWTWSTKATSNANPYWCTELQVHKHLTLTRKVEVEQRLEDIWLVSTAVSYQKLNTISRAETLPSRFC